MRNFVFILMFCAVSQITVGQDFSGKSLSYGLGIGASSGLRHDGLGQHVELGYKAAVWKNRLRLHPNLTIGAYNTKFITDIPDSYFNSINLKMGVEFDLLKIKGFSLLIESGGFVNLTRGLKGTGGEMPREGSSFFSYANYGFILSGGFRVAPLASRIAYFIKPWTFLIGPDYFFDFQSTIGIEVRLRKGA